MKKSNLPAFATQARKAFESLKEEYREQLIAQVKLHGQNALCRLIGKSENYLHETLKNNNLKGLKNAVELIAEKVYGWNP